MSRSRNEPSNVPQITELHKYKKVIHAIYAFNSMVLDEKTKWYSERMTKEYFSTREEYDSYMNKIKRNPMDFSTIRKKISKNKYKKSSDLFTHMALVFKNAMIYNEENAIWYKEAQRLNIILQCLKDRKAMAKVQWKPSTSAVRACPQCNNIMTPHKTIKPRRCAECSANINGQRMDCYCCNNHTDHARNFCTKCVQKYCYKCGNWHVGKRCHVTKNSNRSKSRTNHDHTSTNSIETLNLAVPTKPHNIESVRRFELIKCKSTLIAKMVTIIQHIKSLDVEGHFFTKVTHPQYAKLVDKPIHFGQILKKMNRNKYKTLGAIKTDIDLLWSNCYLFNGRPDVNNPELKGFANWAAVIEATLNDYIQQLAKNLTAQGWIADGISPKSSSVKKTSKKKKKKKDKNEDDDIVVLNENKTEIKSDKNTNNKSLTKNKCKAHIVATKIQKKSHLVLRTRTPPNVSSSSISAKHNNNDKNVSKKCKSKSINNAHNVSKKIAPNNKHTVTNNNKNNKKQNIINDDDDDSSISSIDNEDGFTNNKQSNIDIDKLLSTNAGFYEMVQSPNKTDTMEKIETNNHKQSKKRSHASYSDTNDEEDEYIPSNRPNTKKPRVAPSSSPPLSGISVSSTERNQAPTIPITPNTPNTQPHMLHLRPPSKNKNIPRKRTHFEFNNDSNIEAPRSPPNKKQKIATLEPSVYGVNDGIPNNVTPLGGSIMSTNPIHYPYQTHSVISHNPHAMNNMNTMHHNNMYNPIHHTTTASVTDVDPSTASHLSGSNHHSRIHTSPTVSYAPAMTEIADFRLNPSMAHSVIHSSTYPSTYPNNTFMSHYPGNPQQPIFIQPRYDAPIQPQYNTQQMQVNHSHHSHSTHSGIHSIPSGAPPNHQRKKPKTTKSSTMNPTQLTQAPTSYTTRYPARNTASPIEYHLRMAEKLITESTPYPTPCINATPGSLQPTNLTNTVSPPMINNSYHNPQQSTVTTSTSSSINSQQHILSNSTHNSHSNEYNDTQNMMYHTNYQPIIQKIIKGIYSKATSLDSQDLHHPAKTFETIDKFPQPHGIRAIAIFDIHQKLTNNKESYKALWEPYYDFAYIWSAQIHYNTSVREIAQSFGKYVDEIFNNVLRDVQMFESIKSKANEELQKVFKPMNNVMTYNDERSVGTIAYKHAEHLFIAPNTKNVLIAPPNMKTLQRITSDVSHRTDDSECKPILASIQRPFVVDDSVSPSLKSHNSHSNDRLSVASHSSKTSKTLSKASKTPTISPVPTNAVPSAISNPSISPIKITAIKSKVHKAKASSVSKHHKSKKKKKKDRDKKSKKKKKDHKRSKKKTMLKKRAISTIKTRHKNPVITKMPTISIVHKKGHKLISKSSNRALITTKPSVKRASSVGLLSPSPPPPDILMDTMDAMSDCYSMIDASPFLKPSQIQQEQVPQKQKQQEQQHVHAVSFANDTMDHVPSPPTFIFDDDGNNNMEEMNHKEDNCSVITTMTAMTMGFEGKDVDELMGAIPVNNIHQMNQNIEHKTNKDYSHHMNNDNDDDDHEDDSEPFNFTKIPKKNTLIKDEPLKIAIDSDDDDDVMAEQQIQAAHERELAERQRRLRQKEERERKEKEKEAKEAAETVRIQQQIAHEEQIQKQKEKQIEMQKMKEIEIQKQIEIEKQIEIRKQKEIEIRKQKEIEIQKQKEKQIEIQKQKEKQIQTVHIEETTKSKPKRFKLSFNKGGKKHKQKGKSPSLKPLQSVVKSTCSKARPIVQRTKCFGDHLFKEQRALRLYYEFKRTESGSIFENENSIKGRYGINVSELIAHNTFALRLIPYLIEREQFMNLPQDVERFYIDLFDLAQSKLLNTNANINVLSVKFAKYHFNLLYKCHVLNADYEWRRHYPQIDSDFAGKKWVQFMYKIKELCILHRFPKLFEAFDPAIRPEDDAEISCAAIRLWRRTKDNHQNAMTLFEIELKLQNQLYVNNDSIKHDIQSALDNLQEIFHENEGYRCFIDQLRNEWIGFKTEFLSNLNNDCARDYDNDEKENIARYYSIFDCLDECVEYYYNQKTEKQKELAQQLKVDKIIEDRIISTKSEGDCSFFYVKYKDCAHDMVWEPKIYMLQHYREETRAFIRNKKKCHLDVLLTHPNNLHGHKAFLNEQSGWIPRYQEQFAPMYEIPHDVREHINRIASQKAALLRKEAKQKYKQRKRDLEQKQQEIERDSMNDNCCNFWKETSNESQCKAQSNVTNDHSIAMPSGSFSFSFKSHEDEDEYNDKSIIDRDTDNDVVMSSSSQSIFSQNTYLSTLSTQSPIDIPEAIIDMDIPQAMDIIDDGVGLMVQPLTVLTSAQSNGTNDDDEDDNKSSLHITDPICTPSLLPEPPPMPDQALMKQI